MRQPPSQRSTKPHPAMIRWHPADCAEVTGPGTAIGGLHRLAACRAVFSAPLRSCSRLAPDQGRSVMNCSSRAVNAPGVS